MGDGTKMWLREYTKTSSYEKYTPHITLRCRKIDVEGFPKTFNANNVGLFHAGDGSTCRKLLKNWELK